MLIDLDNPPDIAKPYAELCAELKAERDGLLQRRDELLALVVKLSNTVPFQDEYEGMHDQRAALVAEIGTLRGRILEIELEQKAALKCCNEACGEQFGSFFDVAKELKRLYDYESDAITVINAGQLDVDQCKHNALSKTFVNGKCIGQHCLICWLPVGIKCRPKKSNDSGVVEVEMRAAELAAMGDLEFVSSANRGELGGYGDFEADSVVSSLFDGWDAGWLSAAIDDT